MVSRSDEDFVLLFCQYFEKELRLRQPYQQDLMALYSYYSKFFNGEKKLIPISALGYSRRLIPAIREIKTMPEKGCILDAGCGYGTESLLFSLLGKEVIGVDLVRDRIDLAQSRVSFYRSICRFPLRIRFVNANLFRYLDSSSPLDLIWAMESISHIFPPEKFLELAFNRLNPGGKLIVSDPNGMSPLAFIRSVKIRGSLRHRPHCRFKDPADLQPVDYGQERIFSFRGFKQLLSSVGFKIDSVSLSGYLGTSLIPNTILEKKAVGQLLSTTERLVKKMPFIRLFGTLYTIVASKPVNA
jgi:SAM-dependent methyltransferase